MANPVCEVLLTEDNLKTPRKSGDLSVGAIVDFSGIVRESEDGREIDGIEYEAHRPMAEHQLQIIGREALGKFGLQLVIIHHRLGFVGVGQASLILRVAGQHRAEAFAGGQWIVDELKKRVPIWKRPRFKSAEGGRPVSGAERDLVAKR